MRLTPQKLVVLVLWLFLLSGLWFYMSQQGRPPTVLLSEALDALRGEPLAPLWLLAIYLVRPLFLLPVSLLTVATGMLFGAFWGTAYAALATLLSAAAAYLLGRLFGGTLPAESETAWSQRWSQRLKAYPFETVLLSRFLFVPGDLVNYVSGYLRVSLTAFVGATLIGGAPGLLVGVLAGASLESSAATFRLNLGYLLASAGLLVVSLGVSWWLRRRTSPGSSP